MEFCRRRKGALASLFGNEIVDLRFPKFADTIDSSKKDVKGEFKKAFAANQF